MTNLFSFLMDQVEYHDIAVGKLAAKHRDVALNLYYTPSKLTENSLIFNKKLMKSWWQQGFDHAATIAEERSLNKLKDLDTAG